MSEKKKKIFEWMKAKRSYIVLALCIASAIGTYALLQHSATPQILTKQSPTPQNQTTLPDLAEYFPPELEPEAIRESRKQQVADEPENTETTEENTSITASTDTATEEKEPLTYLFPVEGEIMKPFSGNTLIYSNTLADWRTHSGIDIQAPDGTNVVACADGVVEEIFTDDRMGITIILHHPGGIRSVYSNLSSGLLVEVGQSISAGETISTIGSSALYEAADATHLHFEMLKDGEPIDPQTLLK